MEEQEMFDAAVRGLRAQGWEQAREPDGTCVFFDKATGHRCALGHCVSLEEAQAAEAIRNRNVSPRLQQLLDSGFGFALQTEHDDGYQPAYMEEGFRALGRRHGLTWPEEPADA